MLTPDALAEAKRLLIDLVQIPSPSRGEGAAVRHLVDWLAAHGCTAHIDAAGNAVGVRGTGERTVILLGHIDTFGGNFPVRLDGRRLYGRGAVDAKGSLCAFAAAAVAADLPSGVRLIVIGAVEEECATSAGARYAAAQYQPVLCIIGEPSAWDRITLGYKGRLLIDWRWEGGLGHSAGPTLTPAEHAVAYWECVRAAVTTYNANHQRLFDRIDAALTSLNTGTDGVHGWAALTIGLRLPPGVDPAAVPDPLAAVLNDPDKVRVYGHERAVTADRDSALSRALRAAIRAEGGQPAFVVKTGTADMNVVAPIWNCPVVAYGPGDSALDHTPDEHLDLDEYDRAIRVLTRVLEQI